MSDLTAHNLAVTLADFLETAANAIAAEGQAGCTINSVIVTPGSPSLEDCNQIAVWISRIGFSDIPNQDAGVDQILCAGSSWVELVWRVATCITVTGDGRSPATVDQHLSDALCFDVYAFGLYQRLMVDPADVFGMPSCEGVSAGSFEVGVRSGGRVFGEQSIRVQVNLVRPTS